MITHRIKGVNLAQVNLVRKRVQVVEGNSYSVHKFREYRRINRVMVRLYLQQHEINECTL